jgi:transposase-like protein
MASRRNFSDEYKREAVRLATESGVTKANGRRLSRTRGPMSRRSLSGVTRKLAALRLVATLAVQRDRTCHTFAPALARSATH